MGKFNPKDYSMVKDRLKLYQEEYEDFRVTTEIVGHTEGYDDIIMKATLYKNAEDQERGLPHATGIAEELRDAGYINKTSHVENAETSAVGRALANINYHGSDKRPSAEEMSKVERTKKAKSDDSPVSKEKTKKSKEPEKTEEGLDQKIIDNINSKDSVPDVVGYFNEEIEKRSGKDKDTFQQTYGPIANDRVQEIKEDS